MDATRRDSDPGTLSEGILASDPMAQFARWLADAQERGIPEPTAMVLATVSAQGRPRARTVLLKAHDPAGFTFYTNRTSRKGRDLTAQPTACVVFPWFAMGRQVTAEGSVQVLSPGRQRTVLQVTAPRVADRGLGQQAIAGHRIPRRARPSRRRTGAALAGARDIPMPGFWGGYLLIPDTVEFWQSGAYRLHDRLRYRRDGDGWTVERLSP